METALVVAGVTVLGSLLGTFAGGLIVSISNYYVAKMKQDADDRKSEAEHTIVLRRACRLLYAELQIVQRNLDLLTTIGVTTRESVKMETWDLYKGDFAAQLPWKAFQDVVEGVSATGAYKAMTAHRGEIKESREYISDLLPSVNNALDAIKPHLKAPADM